MLFFNARVPSKETVDVTAPLEAGIAVSKREKISRGIWKGQKERKKETDWAREVEKTQSETVE